MIMLRFGEYVSRKVGLHDHLNTALQKIYIEYENKTDRVSIVFVVPNQRRMP